VDQCTATLAGCGPCKQCERGLCVRATTIEGQCPPCQTCDATSSNSGCIPVTDGATCAGGTCSRGQCVSGCGAGCGRCLACVDGRCVKDTTNANNVCPVCQTCGATGCEANSATTVPLTCPGGVCREGLCVSSCPTAGCGACKSCREGKCVPDVAASAACPECSKCSSDGTCVPDGTISTCSSGVCANSQCTNSCPAAGCPECKACRSGTCAANPELDGKQCTRGTCKNGECVPSCPANGCPACQVCGTTGQCNIAAEASARGCPACQMCIDGQCGPDPNGKCDGTCERGVCAPACGTSRCAVCQSCTNGQCANDDAQKCFGGTCQTGACKCGTESPCALPNVCQDGKCVLGCPELLRNLANQCKCPLPLQDLRSGASCPGFCELYFDPTSSCKNAVEQLKRCATDLGMGTYVTQAQNIIDKVC